MLRFKGYNSVSSIPIDKLNVSLEEFLLKVEEENKGIHGKYLFTEIITDKEGTPKKILLKTKTYGLPQEVAFSYPYIHAYHRTILKYAGFEFDEEE